jgi:hypothetical protein
MIEALLSKKDLLRPLLSILLIVAGLAYLVYLRVLFPTLVPGYGGGERFTLGGHNDYTLQMPWHAHTRLHVALQANDTVELHIDGDHVCNCTRHEFSVEAGEQALVLLRSDSPVSGAFTAWQETPIENWVLALLLILTGITGTVISMVKRGPLARSLN